MPLSFFKLKHLRYFIEILLIIIILLLFRSVKISKNQNSQLQTEKDLALQKFKVERNKVGDLLILQDIIVSQNDKIIDSLVNERQLFKNKIRKPKILIQETSHTTIDSIFVPYHDTLFLPSETNLVFKDSTKFYYIAGEVKSKGVQLNKISFINKDTYVIASKRYNLFYNKQVLYINHQNPYTNVTGVQSIMLKQKTPKKFVRIARIVIPFITGMYLGYKLNNE